jgi:hypothetical protein
MFGRKNMSVLSEHYRKLVSPLDSNTGDDEILEIKRIDHELTEDLMQEVRIAVEDGSGFSSVGWLLSDF